MDDDEDQGKVVNAYLKVIGIITAALLRSGWKKIKEGGLIKRWDRSMVVFASPVGTKMEFSFREEDDVIQCAYVNANGKRKRVGEASLRDSSRPYPAVKSDVELALVAQDILRMYKTKKEQGFFEALSDREIMIQMQEAIKALI